MKKRMLTLWMALCVTFSSLPADVAVKAAAETRIQSGIEETEEVEMTDTEEPETETETPKETETENTEDTGAEALKEPETEITETPEDTKAPEETETEPPKEAEAENTEDTETEIAKEPETEITETPEDTEAPEETGTETPESDTAREGVLNFMMVESARLQTPETQRIVASLGSGETELSDLTLTYQNLATGEEYTVAAQAVAEDMALFSIEFTDEKTAGVYQILRVEYRSQGERARIEVPEQEMDVRFGVNTEVSVEPDQVLYDEKALASIEADVITMDENGSILSENTVEDVPDDGLATESILRKSGLKAASGPVVVVLDPGHDDTHAGAQQNGAGEEDLVLKIAQYCKEELSTYSGISVYMTRDGGACPNGGGSVTSGVCNEKRVAYAQSVGADLYVSFHLNSAVSSSVNGVAVYYPNSNYQAWIGSIGEGVATQIYYKLAALGLSAWGGSGIKIWNASYDKYPDGSTADYLGVIRNCKKAGIPAVLIEHAFLSGKSDYANFLNSDEKLKKLGLADAAAIADYYGLTKGLPKTAIEYIKPLKGNQLKISWNAVAGSTLYEIWRSTEAAVGYQNIAKVTGASTYTDTSAEPGIRYYYIVRCIDGKGAASGYSDAVSGIILVKPKLIFVGSKNSSQLKITWEKTAGASGYRIKRSVSKNGSYQVIKDISSGGTTSYVDKSVKAGKTYYYKVEAVFKGGDTVDYSGDSNIMRGKTIAAPQIKSLKATSSSSVLLKWKKVSGVNGYQIYRSASKSSGYKRIATLKGAGNTDYEDADLQAGKTYYYKIRSYKKSGEKNEYSSYSGIQKAWTLKKVVMDGEGESNGRKIVFRWKKVSKASQYSIYRSTSAKKGFKKIAVLSSKKLTYTDKEVKTGNVYYYKVAANNSITKGTTGTGDYSKTICVPVLAKTNLEALSFQGNHTIQASWKKVAKASGYELACATAEKGKYAALSKSASTSFTHTDLQQGTTYYYKVRAYVSLKDGSAAYGAWSDVKSQTAGHDIMGASTVSVAQMAAYYGARYTFPAEFYAEKGASTAEEFFTILKEEAEAEGVRAEVLFAQLILETGGLKFGGDVSAEQCNFGGLGAVGNGAPGETFPDIRTGLRAQTQHLKAYAGTDPLNNPCVDSRFSYVSRGSAPYIEWLAIPKNPNGKGWAADAAYGDKLLKIIASL